MENDFDGDEDSEIVLLDVIPRLMHEEEINKRDAIIAALVLKFGGGVVPLYEDDLMDTVGQRVTIQEGMPLSGCTIKVDNPDAEEVLLPEPTHPAPKGLQ